MKPTIRTHQPRPRRLKAVWLSMCAIVYRYLCEIIFFRIKIQRPKFWAAQKLNDVRSYPVRPMLKHHIFIPKSHQEGQTHPVYFLIHGVAFIVGTPAMDNVQSRFLSDQHDYVVASLAYRRAPEHRFPTAIHDIAAVIAAILDDGSLPVDRTKVMVGGFSAGATISLAVGQLPSLKDRITALVAFQPMTDRSGEARGTYLDKMPCGGDDDMKKTQELSDWAFPAAGQDLRDRLLSPYHASRSDIPQPVCFVTGTADMFCQEACLLAAKLAGRSSDCELGNSWEQNGVKYWCAKDMPHGWTHFWVRLQGEWHNRQLQAQQQVWEEVTTCLDRMLYG
ncbi:Alpha/Beta hydrolase protein [Aspergillus aurantiobrunneus]